MIYVFWTERKEIESSFIMDINLGKKEVVALLNEYTKSDPEYNNEGWIEFLTKKGIKNKKLDVEEFIYF